MDYNFGFSPHLCIFIFLEFTRGPARLSPPVETLQHHVDGPPAHYSVMVMDTSYQRDGPPAEVLEVLIFMVPVPLLRFTPFCMFESWIFSASGCPLFLMFPRNPPFAPKSKRITTFLNGRTEVYSCPGFVSTRYIYLPIPTYLCTSQFIFRAETGLTEFRKVKGK
jgi:hypothetical protein